MFFYAQSAENMAKGKQCALTYQPKRINMPATIDYQTRTECSDDAAIYTDQWDDGVYLSVMISGGSARATLTRDQAHALIDAIQFALSANEATA
jgi:hypothetical protein